MRYCSKEASTISKHPCNDIHNIVNNFPQVEQALDKFSAENTLEHIDSIRFYMSCPPLFFFPTYEKLIIVEYKSLIVFKITNLSIKIGQAKCIISIKCISFPNIAGNNSSAIITLHSEANLDPLKRPQNYNLTKSINHRIECMFWYNNKKCENLSKRPRIRGL